MAKIRGTHSSPGVYTNIKMSKLNYSSRGATKIKDSSSGSGSHNTPCPPCPPCPPIPPCEQTYALWKQFMLNYLTDNLNWNDEDANNCLDWIINEYKKNPDSYLGKIPSRSTFDNLTLSDNLYKSWVSGSTTDISGRWRQDNFKGTFFPNIDMSGVTNANRCLHSNYNTLCIPSLTFPEATNIGGMFYYDDCHWFGNMSFPSVTSLPSTENPFGVGAFRNKFTITFDNLVTWVSGLFQQEQIWSIPTLVAPKLTTCRRLFSGSTLHDTFDIIKELGFDFSNINNMYCAFYTLKQDTNYENSVLDFSNVNFENLEDARWMIGVSNIDVIIPKTWNLPNLKVAYAMFGNEEYPSKIEEIDTMIIPNCSLQWMFDCMPKLKKINKIVCTNSISSNYSFDGSDNIEIINSLEGLGCGFKSNISDPDDHHLTLTYTKLKAECLNSLFNSLGIVPDGITDARVELPSHLYEQGVITQELRDILHSKNWKLDDEN